MMAATSTKKVQLDPAEVRAQVARMTASEVFANSPQLSAFLLFVVEAVLRGKGDRLKGYTIGVEVLRRDTSFDPQLDPIVRVEATRLRRALDRYYGGPGAQDKLIIELPRGGYEPRISRRGEGHAAVPAAKSTPGASPQDKTELSPGSGLPTLRVAPFVVIGTPDGTLLDSETLSGKLSEVFALFHSINVVAAAPPASGGRYDYRLDGTLEYGGRNASLRVKLVDKADETVIWSRAFDQLEGESCAEAERKVITNLTTTIAQRFGIIWSRERARQLAGGTADPRYRAIIAAGEAFRSFDKVAVAQVHRELERLTELDPGFAPGFSNLAIVSAFEYTHDFGTQDDADTLDRALRLARRGVELKPQSAFAYHVLFIVLFLRGETAAASAAAEQAVSLNPYDIAMRADYGGRLVLAGELDRGMAILRETTPFGAILPTWTHFYLFLGHYLRDEIAEARFHAGQLTNQAHIYGQLARVLMAHRDGRTEEAQSTIASILAARPDWKRDPRRQIGKLITGKKIADRVAQDFADAGLRAADE